jgi:sugar phosphate isomerase/epimerase
VHPRACVSAISTFRLPLLEDLEFWERHGITAVGVSVAKLEAHGWDDGLARLADAVAGGLDVANLIGLGPFTLAEPSSWPRQQERLARAVDAAARLDAGCLVCTTGPAGPLDWDEAADALAVAWEPVLHEARTREVTVSLEHTNSLRVDVGFVHSLRDALDVADRLGVGVCMEVNACWAERDLAATIHRNVDRIRLVQVSDFRVGTLCTPDRLVPGDGDIPLERILRTLEQAGYRGRYDLEVIGPRIEDEGYGAAVPRAVDALGALIDAAARGASAR